MFKNISPKMTDEINKPIKLIEALYKETLNLNDLSIIFFVVFTYITPVRKMANKNIKNLTITRTSNSREKYDSKNLNGSLIIASIANNNMVTFQALSRSFGFIIFILINS